MESNKINLHFNARKKRLTNVFNYFIAQMQFVAWGNKIFIAYFHALSVK